jgi:hypothetical protein
MSEENVELAKILLPQPGTDIVSLIRDEATYARMAEAARPFLTDDFESVMVWPERESWHVGATTPNAPQLSKPWGCRSKTLTPPPPEPEPLL